MDPLKWTPSLSARFSGAELGEHRLDRVLGEAEELGHLRHRPVWVPGYPADDVRGFLAV